MARVTLPALLLHTENALKRAEELENVGQKHAALQVWRQGGVVARGCSGMVARHGMVASHWHGGEAWQPSVFQSPLVAGALSAALSSA